LHLVYMESGGATLLVGTWQPEQILVFHMVAYKRWSSIRGGNPKQEVAAYSRWSLTRTRGGHLQKVVALEMVSFNR